MGEVKWIKITTNMFEDEKIDFIQSLPEADAITVIWVRLLTMAGKCNSNGYIFLSQSIPYDESMLAHKFRKPTNIIRLALQTLSKLGMIEWTDEGLKISNWEKHQNVDGLDKIREQNRIRQQKYRENQKMLESNVTDNVTVTQGNGTEVEVEREKESNKSAKPPSGINSFDYKVCIAIWDHVDSLDIKAKLPKKDEKGLAGWANEIRKMREIDKYTEDDIRTLFAFYTSDNFWHDKIRSGSKFREKAEDLMVACKRWERVNDL